MTIEFPNHSRSYDPARSRIRFWGYDRAMEIAFILEEEALRRIAPETPRDEAGILRAFDVHRDRISAMAAKAYTSKPAFTCILTRADV